MINFVEVLRKKITPSDYGDFTRKDTVFAFLFFCIITLITFVGIYIENEYLLSPKVDEVYIKLYNTGTYCVMFVVMIVMLKMRHQGLKTVGIKKTGLLASIILGSILISYFIFCYIIKYGFRIELLFYLIYYMIIIGFVEEVTFRGYLWGRLYKEFGFVMSTIITGLMFSLAHFPLDYVMNNKSIWDLATGNVNISLLGGVGIHFIFSYIYSRTNNIVLPAIVHGFMDIFSILN